MASDSNLVFVLAGRRTGGSAIALGFRRAGFHLFYDPLNRALLDINRSIDTSQAWQSRHPDFEYWEEFAGLDVATFVEPLADACDRTLDLTGDDEKRLAMYVRYLTETARRARGSRILDSGREIFAFKIEQLAAYRALKRAFPKALFLGLRRDKEEQFESGLNQTLAYSNPFFLESEVAIANLARAEEGKIAVLNPALFDDVRQGFDESWELQQGILADICDVVIQASEPGQTSLLDDKQALVNAPKRIREAIAAALIEWEAIPLPANAGQLDVRAIYERHVRVERLVHTMAAHIEGLEFDVREKNAELDSLRKTE